MTLETKTDQPRHPLKLWIKITVISLLCAFWLAYCSPPKYGWWLSENFNEAKVVYQQRMLKHFPIGSNEDELISFLTSENFTLRLDKTFLRQGEHYRSSAWLERGGLPCMTEWRIHWNAENGKITELIAVRGTTCL